MYKTSSELKRTAKDSLAGRWGEAIKLSLVPVLISVLATLGVILMIGVFGALGYFMYENGGGEYFDDAYAAGYDGFSPTFSYIVSPIISVVWSIITIGISFTFLDVIRREDKGPLEVKDAFRLFNGNDFVPVFLINLVMNIFIGLWSMLFLIPGIVKTYSYSQSNFIYKDLSTHEDTKSMGVTSFITESRELMNGHKGRLFWLDLTFIGWHILAPFTLGLLYIYLIPYQAATKAAFYEDLSKGRYLKDEEAEAVVEEDGEWTNF